MIKAVLIDIDNTLLDFDEYVRVAMRQGFEKFGLCQYTDGMFSTFTEANGELWREIEQGKLTYTELLKIRWNRIFSALGISFEGYTFEKYFKECLFDSAIHVHGAEDILAYLCERYILCAASNGPYKQQLNRLEKGNMLQYFSRIFISEDVGASKPSREFFIHCMNALNEDAAVRGEGGILPCEVIMIGDSLTSDISGAAAMGIVTCFFDKNGDTDTSGISIDYKISDLREIRAIL